MKQQEMFGSAMWLSGRNAGVEMPEIQVLRSKFKVGKVKSAFLRVLGLGFFHCYLNGQRVSEDLFLPLSTDFEPRVNYPIEEVLSGHRVYVPEYDVSSMLRDGENTIAMHFGGGWYTFGREAGYGKSKAIWRIFGEAEDGKFDFVSSESDKIGESYVRNYSFTQNEDHDYLAASVGVVEADFDDSGWRNAAPAKPLDTEYEFSDCPADRVSEKLSTVKVGTKEDAVIYDCGKNISGYPALKLLAARGEKVTVRFSEELDEDGGLSEKFSHRQSMSFVSDGEEKTVSPLFTWFGFRYFSIEGKAEPCFVEVVHSSVEVTSRFESDNELLNWIHDTYVNTQLTNMHAGIPSDCPHIERRGYTGDGQLTCHAAMNILDAQAFYRKWMQDIADCQDILSGHIQYTAPYIRSGGGPGGWGCAIVEVPYQYYLHYGDAEVLQKYYPNMIRYFDYLESHSYGRLIVSDKKGEWCLGDWCPPTAVCLPAPFVNNYFYIKSLVRCVEIAKIIGREEDIPGFEQRIAERKEAIMAAYFNVWDGNFIGNLQGANAFAADIGLGDERTYRNLAEYYRKIKRFDTGIFGTDIVTKVLFEHGEGQLAVDLLLSDHITSFAGMKRLGATTLWEYWPESLKDRSHNHPMFGAVAAYLYDYLLGIRAKEGCAAYREIVIEPVIVEQISRLSGFRMLPAGKVEVSYEKVQCGIDFEINLPANLSAKLIYRDRVYELQHGKNSICVKCEG